MRPVFLLCCIIWILLPALSLQCKFYTTVLRHLKKEGFHLQLLSTVEIVVVSEDCPTWNDCTLSVVDNVGSSFYADENDLASLPVNSCISGYVNIEQPQSKATPHTVCLHSRPILRLNLVQSHFSLPLHLRYHSPRTGGGFEFASLHRPTILLQCCQYKDLNYSVAFKYPQDHCSCSRDTCDWVELPFKTNADDLSVAVPVGDLNHYLAVAGVSYILAFGGVAYLSLAILQCQF